MASGNKVTHSPPPYPPQVAKPTHQTVGPTPDAGLVERYTQTGLAPVSEEPGPSQAAPATPNLQNDGKNSDGNSTDSITESSSSPEPVAPAKKARGPFPFK